MVPLMPTILMMGNYNTSQWLGDDIFVKFLSFGNPGELVIVVSKFKYCTLRFGWMCRVVWLWAVLLGYI